MKKNVGSWILIVILLTVVASIFGQMIFALWKGMLK